MSTSFTGVVSSSSTTYHCVPMVPEEPEMCRRLHCLIQKVEQLKLKKIHILHQEMLQTNDQKQKQFLIQAIVNLNQVKVAFDPYQVLPITKIHKCSFHAVNSIYLLSLPLFFCIQKVELSDDLKHPSFSPLVSNLLAQILRIIPSSYRFPTVGLLQDYFFYSERQEEFFTFLVFHELAHLLANDCDSLPATLQASYQREFTADLQAIKDTPEAIEGAFLFFQLIQKYQLDEKASKHTHPLCKDRIQHLKNYINTKYTEKKGC